VRPTRADSLSSVAGVTESGHLRLFVALDLPGDAREAIAAWQRANAEAVEAGGWRPVAPENLHVTLAFLGDHPESRVGEAASLIESLDAVRIPAMLLPEPVPLPRRQPRLMALEVESEAAAALQAPLATRLGAAGFLEPEDRPFWPHITVFRRSRGAVERAAPGARIAPIQGADGGHGHAFGFVRVALYRSQNRPDGSSYSRLAARDLPRPGGNTEEVK
jgi:2'-5' RNA ligase